MNDWRQVDGGAVGKEPKRWTVPRPGPDGRPLGVLTVQVVAAVHLDELRAERDRFRAALTQIANAESGPWGRIAHNALHPEREAA